MVHCSTPLWLVAGVVELKDKGEGWKFGFVVVGRAEKGEGQE